MNCITMICNNFHTKRLAQRLHKQCQNMEIPTINSENDLKSSLQNSDVILDAIFGFSFLPPVRSPFDTALKLISDSKLPIVSVDVPSGMFVASFFPKNAFRLLV